MIENTPASPARGESDETLVIVAPGLRIVMRGVSASSVLRPGDPSTISIDAGADPPVVHVAIDPRPAGPGPSLARPGPVLTPRQLEVLALLAEGVRAAAIATRLGVSATTVRNHIRDALSRLGCHSQLEAVAEARRRRLLDT